MQIIKQLFVLISHDKILVPFAINNSKPLKMCTEGAIVDMSYVYMSEANNNNNNNNNNICVLATLKLD